MPVAALDLIEVVRNAALNAVVLAAVARIVPWVPLVMAIVENDSEKIKAFG